MLCSAELSTAVACHENQKSHVDSHWEVAAVTMFPRNDCSLVKIEWACHHQKHVIASHAVAWQSHGVYQVQSITVAHPHINDRSGGAGVGIAQSIVLMGVVVEENAG
jgi:hypothetical protein